MLVVGDRNLIEGCSHLPNESNRIVDVLHYILQNLKVVRAGSSNGPLLLGHNTHSKAPGGQVIAPEQ